MIRSEKPWQLVAVVAAGVVLVAAYFTYDVLLERKDDRLLSMLRSGNPELRKRGAWFTLEQGGSAAIEFIARQLELGQEPSADVRESYVYALGHAGDQQYRDLVATLLADDPSGYVRQAAWLALARLEPRRFVELADSYPPTDNPWDQIGRANAWLHTGDVRGMQTLMHWARQGNADQQLVACAALYKGVLPLLEAVGRWPLDAHVREGQIWPPELVAEVERRCAGLDLQRIADDTRPHLATARRVQRNAYRMTSARNRIAKFLLWF